jgi:uncharacterized protein
MNGKKEIDDFLAQKTLAVVGISRSGQAMSNSIFNELTNKGYKVFPVNPNASSIHGVTCYPNLASLPEKVGGAIFFTPPDQTSKAVQEALNAGVTRVWMQQGAQSNEAIEVCKGKNIQAVWGRCVLMFLEPVSSIHGFHRWFAKLFGQLPK